MSAKEIMKNYKLDEIAESFVLPKKLTAKQQKEADAQLKEARKKVQSEMTDTDRLISRILQFKFQMDDYLNNEDFNPKFTFGYFLMQYVDLLPQKRKDLPRKLILQKQN